ncbi:hypothetical protein N7536_005058 [Penicillium majusculum]|nr:hypothetical protein N7536_005058 [Penicillium majusculum]
MIPDRTGATTAQVAKAAQRGVLALFEDILASMRTSELLNEVACQLLSVKKRLGSIIEVEGIFPYDIKLSDRRLALKRIARESEEYEIGTNTIQMLLVNSYLRSVAYAVDNR